MRWLTTDPLRFEDGLNLYAYVHNNPFCCKDPDGRFAFAIPLLVGAFGAGGITLSATTIGTIAGIAIGTTLGWGVYEGLKWVDNTYNQVEQQPEGLQEENKGNRKKAPARTEPKNLEEQLTLEEARHNPGKELDDIEVKDPRYPKQNWKKNQYTHEALNGTRSSQIHYWENRQTGEKHGFKFKDEPN